MYYELRIQDENQPLHFLFLCGESLVTRTGILTRRITLGKPRARIGYGDSSTKPWRFLLGCMNPRLLLSNSSQKELQFALWIALKWPAWTLSRYYDGDI
jgi:hypothetical protein